MQSFGFIVFVASLVIYATNPTRYLAELPARKPEDPLEYDPPVSHPLYNEWERNIIVFGVMFIVGFGLMADFDNEGKPIGAVLACVVVMVIWASEKLRIEKWTGMSWSMRGIAIFILGFYIVY